MCRSCGFQLDATQFCRLWYLDNPVSEVGCDLYLSLLSKLYDLRANPSDMIMSTDGLRCLVSVQACSKPAPLLLPVPRGRLRLEVTFTMLS